MKKLLLIVDYQNDFVDMALATKDSEKCYPHILNLIEEYQKEGNDIIFTRDTHEENYLSTEEGKYLPIKHCIKGTKGWEFYGELEKISKNYRVIEKNTFPSLALAEFLKDKNYDEITIVGLDLAICVLSNAVMCKSAFPNAHIVVDLKGCKTLSDDIEKVAVNELKTLQVEVIDR